MARMVALLLLVLLVSISTAYAEDEQRDEPEKYKVYVDPQADDPDDYKGRFIGMPVIFHTPETGIVGGGIGWYMFRYPGESLRTEMSSLAAAGIYTQNHQYAVALGTHQYLDNERFILDGGLTYLRFPTKYYGLGNKTDKDDEETFLQTIGGGTGSVARRLWADFYLGVNYLYGFYDISETEDDGLLETDRPTGIDGGMVSMLGGTLFWDSRDNILDPRRGGFYTLSIMVCDPAIGGDFSYLNYQLDLRRYIRLAAEHVLAFQGIGQILTGDPPFPLLAQIQLRGIYGGRFIEKSALTLQAEYRFPIVWIFRGAAFLGAGNVEDRLNFMQIGEFKWAGGGGLRVVIDQRQRFSVRLDGGVSQDDYGFYLLFNEAF